MRFARLTSSYLRVESPDGVVRVTRRMDAVYSLESKTQKFYAGMTTAF